MGKGLRKLGVISAVLSFVICLAGGIVILGNAPETEWGGVGLYFIGKAFFVGPMLLITALRGE